MRTMGLIRYGTPTRSDDLWTRLEARRHERDEPVRIAIPAVGWGELAAVAAVVAIVAAVPDPFRFLTMSGMF